MQDKSITIEPNADGGDATMDTGAEEPAPETDDTGAEEPAGDEGAEAEAGAEEPTEDEGEASPEAGKESWFFFN